MLFTLTFSLGSAATPAWAGSGVTNASSGLCLEINGESMSNGALATQWGCNGGAHQYWDLDIAGAYGNWRLINKKSGKCLEIADWRRDDGAPARQWDCTKGENQVWYAIDYDGDGTAAKALVNVHSGKCLEISGWSGGWGVGASQYSCNKGANQLWGGVPR
ncbi:RICIN domain-containing protein [Streptomyces sp. NPDC127584]|uniref:RICIN domain-containing protein n=1 Tax=Streptomyces sp. NPDC127584 TaxID=3345403 RepID=UPI00364554D4